MPVATPTIAAPGSKRMDRLDLEAAVGEYLKPARNPDIARPQRYPGTIPMSPPCCASARSRTVRPPGCLAVRVIASRLNLTDLDAADVLELLYDANGMISRLELFNLKDWADGHLDHIPGISRLQEALNSQNPIKLKRVILEILASIEGDETPEGAARMDKLRDILHDLGNLQVMYRARPLKARIGSDSTGRSPRFHGMGLAVIETLPPRAQRQIKKDIGSGRDRIPIHIAVQRRHTFIERRTNDDRRKPPAPVVGRAAAFVANRL
jgi:hypothetical protein